MLRHYRLNYWHKIYQYLISQGNTVYLAKVPMIAPIQLRVSALLKFLEKHQLREGCHFIGHSMGGLDLRYLHWYISHYKQFLLKKELWNPFWDAIKIQSVTTLATPHLGSLIAERSIEVFEGKRNLWLQPNTSNSIGHTITFQFLLWILFKLVTPALLLEDEIYSKTLHPSFMTENSKYFYNESDSMARKKEIFLKRALTHLSQPWLTQIFNQKILSAKEDATYFSSYGGDITPLLKDVQVASVAINSSSSSNSEILSDVNYPWNVTYPTLLEEEIQNLPKGELPLGNDGLVSVRSSQFFDNYKGTWNILHPNFSRDWVIPLSSRKPPPSDPPNILPLYKGILEDLRNYDT